MENAHYNQLESIFPMAGINPVTEFISKFQRTSMTVLPGLVYFGDVD